MELRNRLALEPAAAAKAARQSTHQNLAILYDSGYAGYESAAQRLSPTSRCRRRDPLSCITIHGSYPLLIWSVLPTRLMVPNSGFFPGFFDSDGRPWYRAGSTPDNYERSLEAAIKIALLTHQYLYLPAGYLLDNPPLQRLILHYSGDSPESLAFQILFRDLIRVSPNRELAESSPKLTDWRAIHHTWASGHTGHRKRLVYLNALPHKAATELQMCKNPDDFCRKMTQALVPEWRIDLNQYFDVLNKLELRSAVHGDFDFDSLIRTKLLSGKENFPECGQQVLEKLSHLAEKTQAGSLSLSRSLLRNREFCVDLGAKDCLTLTTQEYDTIASVLGHYHHVAFAKSLDLDGVATSRIPNVELRAKTALSQELELSLGQNSTRWPLSLISFDNIYKVRCKSKGDKFKRLLNRLHDASRMQNLEQYQTALRELTRFVAGSLSLDFLDANPKEMVATLSEEVFADAGFSKALGEAARFAITFCRDFFPNIGKEMQVRQFFRHVRTLE